MNEVEEFQEFEADPLLLQIMAISAMENGTLKIAAAEEAVRIADGKGDLDLRYMARNALVEAATFGGQPDLLLVHFSWMLAQYDREPDRFDAFDLLWKFKWAVDNLGKFPHIPKAKCLDMLAEMKRRYDAAGLGQHAYEQKRRELAQHLGDMEMAADAHARMKKTLRDNLSDCPACVPDVEHDYLMDLGDPAAALASVKSILSGKLRCAEVPQRTYAKVLLPLLMLDRGTEAMKYHLKGYPLVRDNPGLLYPAVQHMGFLALTANLDHALTLLQRHLAPALAITDIGDRFGFHQQAWITMDRFVAAGRHEFPLRISEDLPFHREGGIYRSADVMAWADGEMKALANQYDERNGNDFFAKKVASTYRMGQFAKPVEYGKSKRSWWG